MRAHILAILLLAGCSLGTSFDRDQWRDADLTGRARADMLPDFLARHALKGMPREQVVALLGSPTSTDKWRGADMVYVLGNDGSMFPIDNECIIIKLDSQGRVASFERVTD